MTARSAESMLKAWQEERERIRIAQRQSAVFEAWLAQQSQSEMEASFKARAMVTRITGSGVSK